MSPSASALPGAFASTSSTTFIEPGRSRSIASSRASPTRARGSPGTAASAAANAAPASLNWPSAMCAYAELALERGLRGRVVQGRRAELADELLRLPELEHRLRELRRDRRRRVLVLERAAQFLLGRDRVARLEQELAEQVARLAVLRRLLQGVLELDRRRRAVVLRDVLLGGGDELCRIVARAAAGGEHGGAHEQPDADDAGESGVRCHRFPSASGRG